MAAGPGITKNSWCREPVALYDLYATIHALLGAPFKLPDNLDSVSIRELLLNGGEGSVKRKPKTWKIEKLELFNLASDIGEKNDLSAKMPEKAKEMATALTTYLKAVNAETPGVKKWTDAE